MMQNELDRAYDLIKEGRNEEAIAVLEPIIRSDRDNGDAWWLLANATNDPQAQRNALNNVLRIGASTSREHKARLMLQALEDADDPFADIESSPLMQQAPQRQKFAAPPRRSSPLKWFILGIFGMMFCVCASCVGIIYSAGGSIEKLVALASLPEDYTSLGILERGSTVTGEITSQTDYQAYTYRAATDDKIIIEIESNEDVPPFALVYGKDEMFVGLTSININEGSAGNPINQTIVTLPAAGEYIILVRSVFSLGIAPYTLTVR